MNPALRSPYLPLVAGLLLIATLVLARRPYYNWDMFPYMAMIMATPGEAFEKTHETVYQEARSHMIEQDFHAIAGRQPQLMKDANAFQDILRYHTIKPGYTGLAWLLHQFGIHPLAATWLPSIGSYFLLGLLLFWWSARQAPAPAAGLFTFVIALAPAMIDLARYSSPDMLCALVTTAGVVFLFEGKPAPGAALLFLSILIRPDAVLLMIPLVAAIGWTRKLPFRQAGGWIVTAIFVAGYLLVDRQVVGEYTFADHGLPERLGLYRQGLVTLAASYTLPLVGVAVATLFIRRSSDLYSLLVWAALGSIVARYLLHPFVEDRFHLPAYLVILMVAWRTAGERVFRRDTSKP